LVFLGETWTKTTLNRLRGWAPKGKRLVDKVPHGRWKTLPVRRAHQRRALPRLCRTVPRAHLKPGDVVILDNLGSHKGKAGRRPIRDVGARLVFCRNTRPTSIRSSRSSPSSKPCCERREREVTKPSPKPALRFSPNIPQKNAPHTSGTPAMRKPKSGSL
jgi:hypothetical protein